MEEKEKAVATVRNKEDQRHRAKKVAGQAAKEVAEAEAAMEAAKQSYEDKKLKAAAAAVEAMASDSEDDK